MPAPDSAVVNVIIQSGAFGLVVWIVVGFMRRLEQHMESQTLVIAELVMQLAGHGGPQPSSTINSEKVLREKGVMR